MSFKENKMIQIFKELFTLDNFFKLLVVIIPSVITYFITKYKVQKPTKIQTKKAQVNLQQIRKNTNR